MQTIDQNLFELKTIETQLEALSGKKDELRKEIFGYIENNGLTDGYKNEIATIAYVERKSVKIKDEESLLKDLKKDKIVKYYKEIPKHYELTAELTKDIKAGVFSHPEIEMTNSQGLQIKFAS